MKAAENKAFRSGPSGERSHDQRIKRPSLKPDIDRWFGAESKSREPTVAQKNEPESSVLKKVFDTLRMCGGVEAFRNNVGAIKKGERYIRYGLDVGSADIVAIVAPHGRWLCIECKRPKNAEVAMAQLKWLDKMRRYGAVCAIVRNPDDVFDLVNLARKATS